jgi:hypothetical protein
VPVLKDGELSPVGPAMIMIQFFDGFSRGHPKQLFVENQKMVVVARLRRRLLAQISLRTPPRPARPLPLSWVRFPTTGRRRECHEP